MPSDRVADAGGRVAELEAPVINGTGSVALDDAAFGAPFHEALVHESVRAELAARRQGTHATRTRGKVSGGGAKPWRQKGTGRARQGSIRAPQFSGGGAVFGPTPRSYTFKVNRKERRVALRSALSVHAQRGTLGVFDPAAFAEAPSTKAAAQLLSGWQQAKPGLVVLTEDQAPVALSFRNLDRVSVLPADGIGVADLIGAAAVLCSPEALEQLSQRVTAQGRRAEAGSADAVGEEA